jgi:two-component system nitrate/nitrite response regulator NarL
LARAGDSLRIDSASEGLQVNDITRENRIRLVLVDDQALFRASLGRYLAAEPDLELAGECDSRGEVLDLLRDSRVDLVLLDFDWGVWRCEELISAARRAGYRGQFLILVAALDVVDPAMAFRPGVSGIFRKSEGPDRLVQAIRLIANGSVWMDQGVFQLKISQLTGSQPALEDQRTAGVLNDREERVLVGILGGLTNRKIGDNIGLSEGSIKAVVRQLFYKAGVRTRSQLVRVALEGSLTTARGLVKRGQSHG